MGEGFSLEQAIESVIKQDYSDGSPACFSEIKKEVGQMPYAFPLIHRALYKTTRRQWLLGSSESPLFISMSWLSRMIKGGQFKLRRLSQPAQTIQAVTLRNSIEINASTVHVKSSAFLKACEVLNILSSSQSMMYNLLSRSSDHRRVDNDKSKWPEIPASGKGCRILPSSQRVYRS